MKILKIFEIFSLFLGLFYTTVFFRSLTANAAEFFSIQSISEARKLIEEAAKNHPPLLVSLDFDGTLAGRSKQAGIEASMKEEENSVELLNFLRESKIHYIINTAASDPCAARLAMKVRTVSTKSGTLKRSEMPCDPIFEEPGKEVNTSRRYTLSKFTTSRSQTAEVKQCDCVFSSGYEKHDALEGALDYLKQHSIPHKFDTIVHIDDGAINTLTMLTELSQNFHVIAIHIPQKVNQAIQEPDEENAILQINEFLKHSKIETKNSCP